MNAPPKTAVEVDPGRSRGSPEPQESLAAHTSARRFAVDSTTVQGGIIAAVTGNSKEGQTAWQGRGEMRRFGPGQGWNRAPRVTDFRAGVLGAFRPLHPW